VGIFLALFLTTLPFSTDYMGYYQPFLTTSCSTKGGREPHFFAFLGKIKNPDFR